MPIRSQIQATPETIAGFEAAAEEKYEGGFNLLASASPGSGVYLMGYVAEMLLKSAYFRVKGYLDSRPLVMTDLYQAKSEMLPLGVSPPVDGFHDLRFWGEAIIALRRSLGKPLSGTAEADLRRTIARLADNWFVGMRYQSLQGADQRDLEAVLDDIVWIKDNHDRLWR